MNASDSMNSSNLDMLMFLENIFETHIPDECSKHVGDPFGTEKSLERQLWNQRPKKDAAALLRILAEGQQRPELAEDLDGLWRRNQISAIVRDIFRKRASPMELHEMLLLPRLATIRKAPKEVRGFSVKGLEQVLASKSSIVLFGALAVLILLYRQLLG